MYYLSAPCLRTGWESLRPYDRENLGAVLQAPGHALRLGLDTWTYIWVNRSTGHTHTHTQNNSPDTDTHTHTRQEQHPEPPKGHPPQTLNIARRWRDDGACHLPRPGGWPRT